MNSIENKAYSVGRDFYEQAYVDVYEIGFDNIFPVQQAAFVLMDMLWIARLLREGLVVIGKN